MHCAKTHQRLSLQLLESEWLSHIACVRFGVPALLPNMLCDRIQLGLSAPRQKNGSAGFSQRERGGPAYPPARKTAVSGKSGPDRVEIGGRCTIKNRKTKESSDTIK